MREDYCDAPPAPPADNSLREVLSRELESAEDVLVRAHNNIELYGRVADACRAGLDQLARNDPQQSSQCVPSYR
jgi:hypothetical protein